MQNNNLINAKVIYKDINTNKTVYTRGITGHSNDPISLKQYEKYVPNTYQFEGYGHFNHYLQNNDTDVIFVKPRQNKGNVKSGQVLVNYIDANDQFINRSRFTNQVGTPFNVGLCKSTVPKNYKFDRIVMGHNVKSYKGKTQMVVIRVSKVRYTDFLIKYVDQQGRQVGQINDKGAVGTKFDINQYVRNVPKGYRFVNITGRIPRTFQGHQTIKINVAKVAQPQRTVNTRNVRQASAKHHNNQAKANQYDSERVGKILMKLATSLHALGETIRNSRNL